MQKVLEVLKKVAANSAVRKAFVALVMAVLAALGFGLAQGCSHPLTPAQARAFEAHECYVAALEPALGELAPEVLKALLAGGNPVQALLAHNLSVAEVQEALRALHECQKPQEDIQPPAALPTDVRAELETDGSAS